MKKLILAFMFLAIFFGSAYGAVSGDISQSNMELLLAEFRLANEQLRSQLEKKIDDVRAELREEIIKVNARVDQLDSKIDLKIAQLDSKVDSIYGKLSSEIHSLQRDVATRDNFIYWGLAFMTIFLAAPSFLEYVKNLRKPSITLEDVQKLIEANNAKMLNLQTK